MATFEKAAIKDISIIQELAYKIWHQYYPGIISVEQINYMLQMMYSLSSIHSELMSQVIYKFVMDGEVPIGYLSYQYEKDKYRIKLNKVYLLPEYHGQGIGQAMLFHAKEEGEKCKADQIYLTVNKNNQKAIRAYKKFGFVITESIVNDIGGGHVMDDFIMTYDLACSSYFSSATYR
ncbi:MAG: GNAT family N-acetyltransferase [Gloeobacterales cyanobacterium]